MSKSISRLSQGIGSAFQRILLCLPPQRVQELLTTVDKSSRVASWGKLPLPDWAVQRVHLHNKFVTVEDKPVSLHCSFLLCSLLTTGPSLQKIAETADCRHCGASLALAWIP